MRPRVDIRGRHYRRFSLLKTSQPEVSRFTNSPGQGSRSHADLGERIVHETVIIRNVR
jgi:hypothetical protein